jgi:hypothetical protein
MEKEKKPNGYFTPVNPPTQLCLAASDRNPTQMRNNKKKRPTRQHHEKFKNKMTKERETRLIGGVTRKVKRMAIHQCVWQLCILDTRAREKL